MKIKRSIKLMLAFLLVILNVGCDQITKIEVRKNIRPNEKIKVLKDNFILTKVENTGAALSLGDQFSPAVKFILLQMLPLLILLFMFRLTLSKQEIPKFNFVGFTFIIGGGIGNLIDRILYDSVTDFMFIDLGIVHTGIFNMADVSVVTGTLFILVNYLTPTKINRMEHGL